ncbi:MAG: cupredoxin domain-containing protein [Parcubacteria group bacterium]|nr:cupredoxin domain-containing protein [Parcubacteria group bacterium]
MPEEQDMQSAPQEAGAEEGRGGVKTAIAVVVVIIIVAAVLVYARGGFGGADTDRQEQTAEEQPAQFGEAQFGDGDTGGNAAEGEVPSGTVIDGGQGFEVDAPEGQTKEFTITGHSFAFSDPNLRVKKGDTVKLTFTSTDGFHDWTVDAFDARTERVNTGDSSVVVFTADKAGEFPFYCSVGSHRQLGMEGKLIVEE